MIIAVGLDIVDVSRIGELLDRYDQRFAERLLGVDEMTIYRNRPDQKLFLAGRFAAKEAVIKTLADIFDTRPAFPSIQILPSSTGKPTVVPDVTLRDTLSAYRWMISISHEKNMAAAVAVLERA